MYINETIKKLVKEFSLIEEVEGVVLAGSHGTQTNDKDSDYDLYVYASKEVSLDKRKNITDKYFNYMELNNTFWECEDDGFLRDNNIPVEIIYRDIKWLDGILDGILLKCEAQIGFTTCFWSNLKKSIILFDRNGELTKLQEKYNMEYPYELKKNIILKNFPLLKSQMPAYYFQIEKALKRNDFISVNHRVAAFFASYFDIIFAINEMPHPGEKKICKIIKDNNLKVPINMQENVDKILELASSGSLEILLEINDIVDNLSKLLKDEGLDFFC